MVNWKLTNSFVFDIQLTRVWGGGGGEKWRVKEKEKQTGNQKKRTKRIEKNGMKCKREETYRFLCAD